MNLLSSNKHPLRVAVFCLAISISYAVIAQPNPDASLLYSRSSISGTARTAGCGGAFSSVGADLGAMDLNPAGLGLFRSSDMSITPGFKIAADQSLYNNGTQSANHPSFDFSQAGIVWNKKRRAPASGNFSLYGLRSFSFAINFQTNSVFSRDQNFSALNTTHSLIDNYVTQANGGNVLPDVGLFTPAGIISNSGNAYASNVRAPVNQNGSLLTRGSNYNLSLGMGMDFGDKLFLGFSLVIPILNYSVNTVMYEGYANGTDTLTHFQNYQLNSTVSESGVGVTGKIGMIYKPVPWARFGVCYSLPTWYFIGENYTGDLLYNFDTVSNEITGSTNQPLNYTLRTPMKGTAGASFYYKDHGFFSIDYDFQNLGSTNFNFTDPGYSAANPAYNTYMKTIYGYSHTVRIGIEGAIKKLRLRAGYSYSNSPFKKGMNYSAVSSYNATVQNASFGIGGRFTRFYIDLAYVFSFTKDALSPNSLTPLDEINSTYMTHTVLLTLGFKLSRENNSPASKTTQKQQRNGDQLPRYIDPGDKY